MTNKVEGIFKLLIPSFWNWLCLFSGQGETELQPPKVAVFIVPAGDRTLHIPFTFDFKEMCIVAREGTHRTARKVQRDHRPFDRTTFQNLFNKSPTKRMMQFCYIPDT